MLAFCCLRILKELACNLLFDDDWFLWYLKCKCFCPLHILFICSKPSILLHIWYAGQNMCWRSSIRVPYIFVQNYWLVLLHHASGYNSLRIIFHLLKFDVTRRFLESCFTRFVDCKHSVVWHETIIDDFVSWAFEVLGMIWILFAAK